MDAIIRNYRVRMEETRLVLTHPAGISFDLTLDEAVGLMEFIKVYQDAIAAAKHDTGPWNEQVVVDEGSGSLEKDGPLSIVAMKKSDRPPNQAQFMRSPPLSVVLPHVPGPDLTMR